MELNARDIIAKLEAGEFDDELLAYTKTAEFRFYNQPYFSQFKLAETGGIEFTANGAKLIPREEFT